MEKIEFYVAPYGRRRQSAIETKNKATVKRLYNKFKDNPEHDRLTQYERLKWYLCQDLTDNQKQAVIWIINRKWLCGIPKDKRQEIWKKILQKERKIDPDGWLERQNSRIETTN